MQTSIANRLKMKRQHIHQLANLGCPIHDYRATAVWIQKNIYRDELVLERPKI